MEPETAYSVYHPKIERLLQANGHQTTSQLHSLFMVSWATRPVRVDIEQCLTLMVQRGQIDQCGTAQNQIYGEETLRVLRKGYYRTKGGYQARLDEDITIRGLGVVPGWGFLAYWSNGEIAYKDENYDPHPGDSLDLLVETWQPQQFEKEEENSLC